MTATLAELRPDLNRLPKRAVERTRLLDKLCSSGHATCVVLQGPAGCGKTTLALQWRARESGAGLDFAWVTAIRGNDLEPFLEKMFDALDQVNTDIAREAAFLFNRDNDFRATEPIAIALLRGLSAYTRRIVLLIDDYHHVADTRVHQLVQMLADFGPAHFRLALLTRSAPSLSLARLRDTGGLVELDFGDLRFTFAEAEELLRIEYASLSRREARVLYDMTDGWAAGLRLVAMSLPRKSGAVLAQQSRQVQNVGEFRTYFEHEVLERLSPADLGGMIRLSIAPRFCESLCVGLFGPELGQSLLARLRRENLFLIVEAEAPAREAWFRFHPLLRDLLQQRFGELPLVERLRIHAVLGESFGRRQMVRAAVHHCVAAGQVEMAADWLERHARSMFLRGELRRLVRAVNELPRSSLLSRPSLRLWVAWSELCYRQFDACRQTLEALKATVPADDLDGRRHLALLEGSLAIQEDDTEAGRSLIAAVEAMAPAHDAILTGGRRNILGWLYLEQRDFPAAQAVLGGSRQFLDDGRPLLESAFGGLVGDSLLGLAWLRADDMRQAEPRLRATLREAGAALGPFSEGAVNAAAFLGAVLYETGEFGAATELLGPLVDLIERVGLPDAVIYAGVSLCRLQLRDGSFQEAFAEVERMEETAQRRRLDRLACHALEQRMAVHLAMGELDAAEEAVTQLRFLAKRHASRSSAAALEVGGRASSACAAWLAAGGRHDEALRTLQALADLLDPARQPGALARLDARMGQLHAWMQRPADALRSFTRAWQSARQLGLQRSLLDLGPEALQWGIRAGGEGLLDDATRFHVEHVRLREVAARCAAGPMPSPSPASDPLSHRELEIVRALAGALPNKRIGLALGISAETVKWHLKNVYAKLGVYGRDRAVTRARELGYFQAP